MSPFDYDTEPLDESEDVLGVFYGGRGQVGQQYVVTNRRLLLGPINVGLAKEINAYVLDQVVPGSGSVLKDVLEGYAPMNPTTLWLRHIVDVQPTNNAQLFKPPGLRITTNTDETFEIGVVKSQRHPNISGSNNDRRDEMLAVLRAAIESAKAAPSPAP